MKKCSRSLGSLGVVSLTVLVAACSGGESKRQTTALEAGVGTGGNPNGEGGGSSGTGGSPTGVGGRPGGGGAAGNGTGGTANGGTANGGTANGGTANGGGGTGGAASLADGSVDSGGPTCAADLKTDNANCGHCGRACGVNAVCSEGHCEQVLVTGLQGPTGITTDATHAYVVMGGDGNVYSVPLAGGVATALVTPAPTTGGGTGQDIVLSGNTLYWSSSFGVMNSVSVNGGAGVPISTNEESPYGVAIQEHFLYWANNYQPQNSIRRADLSKAQPTVSALDPELGVDAGTKSLANPTYIRTSSQYVFWANSYGTGTVYRSNLDGTGVIALGSNLGPVYGLAVDGTNAYYSTITGSVGYLPISGAGGGKVISSKEGYCYSMVVNATDVYWTDAQSITGVYGPSIRRFHKADQSVSTHSTLNALVGKASEIGEARELAIDASHIYWIGIGTQSSSGTVGSVTLD